VFSKIIYTHEVKLLGEWWGFSMARKFINDSIGEYQMQIHDSGTYQEMAARMSPMSLPRTQWKAPAGRAH
jgi:hypothetical protein